MNRKPWYVRWSTAPLVVLAALFVFFEEWLWFRLLSAMKAVARLPFIRAIEPFVRRQNRWVSLLLFAIPELAFIPVKLSVVWLFGNNHPYLGAIVFVTAKLVGTALFAWMYSATEEKITQFAFVRFIRDKILAIRKWAHDWLHRQPAYHRTREFLAEVREEFRSKREHRAKRRMRAAVSLVRANARRDPDRPA